MSEIHGDTGELTGEDIDSFNSGEIPLRMKKAGDYSPYPKMLMCDEKFNLKNRDTLKKIPTKLDDKDNSLKIKLELGKENKDLWIFYWAANSSEDPLKIQSSEIAYGKNENSGLGKIDKDGNIVIELNCPQPYYEEVDGKEKTYCRHVHYTIEDKDNEVWSDIVTRRIICFVSEKTLKKALSKKNKVVINALDKKHFKKYKIPDTINLPQSSFPKKKTKKYEYVRDFLLENLDKYPVIKNEYDDSGISIENIPIITYCANSHCDASKKLVDELYKAGFNNVVEWKEGYEGYNKKLTLFEDAAEEDDSDDDLDESEKVDLESEEIIVELDGVEYLYNNGKLYSYDEDKNLLGGAEITKKNKVKSVKWDKKKYEREHEENVELNKVSSNMSDATNLSSLLTSLKSDSEESSDKEDKEDEEEDKEEDKEDKEEDKSKEEVEEVEEIDSGDSVKSDMSDAEDILDLLYSLSDLKLEEYLNAKDKKKPELIKIIVEMQKRTKGSYTLDKERKEAGDDKEKLIKLITDCGGRIKKGKLEPDEKNPQLKKLSVAELKKIAEGIEMRDSDRYEFNEIKLGKNGKYTTRSNQDELKDVIRSCRGTKKKKKLKGGGWGYKFN